ncbi:tryptophan 7-halogenase [Pseudoduganella sp. SL102]|uniref:tryptophan halogenase family protein n=1 Tax=Pseudoduganella sp. SL102 TaxID=2995154 RepID=UPI00248BA3A0|nr:tryptophan halogenase family protein [Pseudoduganella sp. SL102]WBS03019.1 tryptophan 7-halogenase [Pseudoduganella sp. SL102]
MSQPPVSSLVNHVVIVGGGSAGWLTAGVIAADHPALTVTLVESPDVAPIGVGEGTWPSMRDTLHRIGVSESAFFRECDAAFKQGSRFNGWRSGGGAEDYYFHPFVLPQGFGEADLVESWQRDVPGVPFADLVSFQPHLCVHGRAPKQPATPEFAAVANYGYHLDAGKFGVFLRKHCLEKLGVRYVPDHVTAVNSHDNGDIASLQTREHGALAGDLFIDCTGMQSLLLGRHYGVPLLHRKDVLFNDSALAVQVPYERDDSPIASQTTSTAQRAGWIWDIGLPTRRGIGHVYSSAHTSDEQAEADLRAYIGKDDIPAPRKLTFQPGYREQFWHRNVVAIGLSAGFIEPLEASALALVEMSAAMVSDDLPATREAMDIVARRFNDAFTYRWERVIEFLKLHYVLSGRTDPGSTSDYWHDNRRAETIPARLQELLALWRHRPPSRLDFNRIEEVFPSASWQYVLYGMGFQPDRERITRRGSTGSADGYFREAAELTRKMLRALPSNRELIDHIRLHGLQKI